MLRRLSVRTPELHPRHRSDLDQGFLLIGNSRQSADADLRDELDYEVNVRTFRDIQQIKAMLGRMEERINKVERAITDT